MLVAVPGYSLGYGFHGSDCLRSQLLWVQDEAILAALSVVQHAGFGGKVSRGLPQTPRFLGSVHNPYLRYFCNLDLFPAAGLFTCRLPWKTSFGRLHQMMVPLGS